MSKSFLSRYTVDEVPFFLKPFYYVYGYGTPCLLAIYFLIVRLTSKIVFIGKEKLGERSNYIFCFWHTFICLHFTAFMRHRQYVWMVHPAWFLKPSHVGLRFVGVEKIILGSSGHSGKEAAGQLVEYLKKGYSTVFLPDGPGGPPFQMKKGALHISMQSNVPIVPMRFKATRAIETSNWDRRKWPVPFSRITVEFGEPIQINEADFETAYDLI
jgi:lysophospholipid acyltransferase (LPLAT)-like uncharacterized protein